VRKIDPVLAREGTGKGRVLVIDDDEIARQAISDLLQNGGYAVHPLASPIGATQVLASQSIVAAVIDLNMPIMSGDRFIALIRTWDRTRDLPVVLISGESSETLREAAAALPGVAVVAKAQMNEQLVATLGYALLRKPLGAPTRPSPRNEAPAGKPTALSAQLCLAHWRDLVAMRGLPMSQLIESLDALRAEAQTLALGNIVQLVATTLEIAEQCGGRRPVPAEVDTTVSELLAHLAGVDGDKAGSFDRSLVLTIHRSRLDRARQLLR